MASDHLLSGSRFSPIGPSRPPRHSERHDVITLSPVLAAADCELNGCVGDARSVLRLLAGTGRSSTGKTGIPVKRSSTNLMYRIGHFDHASPYEARKVRVPNQRHAQLVVEIASMAFAETNNVRSLPGGQYWFDHLCVPLLCSG